MAPKKAVKKTDGEDAEGSILQWFEREGEPATAQSLTDALGSKFGKSLVQNVLEQCLHEGKLQAKDIKKARFYFLPLLETTANADADNLLDPARVELLKQLQQQTKRFSGLLAELKLILQKPSFSERVANIEAASAECAALRRRLNNLREETEKNNCNCVKGEDVSLLIGRYNRARQFWRERKRMTERVIDAIFGETCDSKDLADHFGLVTDYEAGVSLAESVMALPQIEGIAVE